MWAQGERNAPVIWQALRDAGYGGSLFSVRRYIGPWRTREERKHLTGPRTAGPQPRLSRPGSNRLAWLILRPQIARLPEEEQLIGKIVAGSPSIGSATSLLREFCESISTKDIGRLTSWAAATNSSGTDVDLRSFANGIRRDWSEVSAAVCLPYNNGRAEGHVNRLKLIKRKMYGRAKFDLLRIRVLASGP